MEQLETSPPAPELDHQPAPDWGCAEFRETIEWMRERWPELADLAEHPILEEMIRADLSMDHKRRRMLQPIHWFGRDKRDLHEGILCAPLGPWQLAAIEMGFAANHERLTKTHITTFWGAVLITGCIQFGVGMLIILGSMDYILRDPDIGIGDLLFLLLILGGAAAQFFSALRQQVQDYPLMRNGWDGLEEALRRASGERVLGAKTTGCLAGGCLCAIALIAAPITVPMILMGWLLVSNSMGLIYLFGGRPKSTPESLIRWCREHRAGLQLAYDRFAQKVAGD